MPVCGRLPWSATRLATGHALSMSIGRNAPCPCGSGRKYKQCCLDADAQRGRSLHLMHGGESAIPHDAPDYERPLVDALDPRTIWEIDAVPLPVHIAREPMGRHCVLMIVADDIVLSADMDPAPPSEPEDIAQWYLTALTMVMRTIARSTPKAIKWPTKLLVRHATVAAALKPLLAPHGTEVGLSARLYSLDNAARSLRAALLGDPWTDLDAPPPSPDGSDALLHDMNSGGLTLMSLPETWAAWGLPDAVLTPLIHGARAYHAAAPWTVLANEQALRVTDSRNGNQQWTVSVLGAGETVFGISIYGSDDDFMRMYTRHDPREMLRGLDDAVLNLSFERRIDVTPALRQEFKRKRWPLAAPDLYPTLTVTNTPAGGVTVAQAGFIARVLDAVVRFTAQHGAVLDAHDAPKPMQYEDAASGLTLRYDGDRAQAVPGFFIVPDTLTPGNAAGPRADALAVIPYGGDVDAWLEHARTPLVDFQAWLRNRAPRGKTAPKRGTARLASDAGLFLDFLSGYRRASLTAVHEADLRIFLYDWFPTKVLGAQRALPAMLDALEQFFAWLESDGLACPWAGPLLRDRAAIEARIASKPSGVSMTIVASPWRDDLYHDLVERVMYPEAMAVDDDELPAYTGPIEEALFGELVRHVLRWREDTIASGVTDSNDVADLVFARQRKWEKTKHAGFGRSPWAAIRAERRIVQKQRRTTWGTPHLQ